MTEVSSWWNHRWCHRCGHTFRRGDKVHVNQSERAVVHLVPGLDCGLPSDATWEAAVKELEAFRDGMLSGWPVASTMQLFRLATGDWRIHQSPERSSIQYRLLENDLQRQLNLA